MKHMIVAALAGAALTGAALPTPAAASCSGQKATGTIIGGVGGALLGNSISRGGGGAILGGLGGAVAGHAIAASGCRHYYRHSYYRPAYHRYYERRGYRYGRRDYAYRASEPGSAGYAGETYGGCPLVNRSYYDDRGNLISQAVPSCGR